MEMYGTRQLENRSCQSYRVSRMRCLVSILYNRIHTRVKCVSASGYALNAKEWERGLTQLLAYLHIINQLVATFTCAFV